MKRGINRHICLFVTILAGVLFASPRNVLAQQHVMSSDDIQREIEAASKTRGSNLEKVDKFFTSQQAKKAFKSAHLDSKQVLSAARLLSDEELERLAARTDKVQQDFAAGALTNQQITYILIALATAVIIIVIVVA